MMGPRLAILGIALVLGFGLAGCGQKGPLYLPPPAAAPQSRAPSESPPARTMPQSPDAVPSTSEKQ